MTELHKPDVRKANICPPCPPTATAWEKCVYWLGIGLGSGLPKRAAGTWGTVGGLIVAIPMLWLGFWGFLAVTIVGCLVGSYICGKTSDLMGVHDDPHIVFDEWVGMWIALLWVSYKAFPNFGDLASYIIIAYIPSYNANHLINVFLEDFLTMLVLPFVLFRFFDIIKPFPIKWVDKNVSGGFGILIDDLLAGIMALILYILSIYFIIIFFTID